MDHDGPLCLEGHLFIVSLNSYTQCFIYPTDYQSSPIITIFLDSFQPLISFVCHIWDSFSCICLCVLSFYFNKCHSFRCCNSLKGNQVVSESIRHKLCVQLMYSCFFQLQYSQFENGIYLSTQENIFLGLSPSSEGLGVCLVPRYLPRALRVNERGCVSHTAYMRSIPQDE